MEQKTTIAGHTVSFDLNSANGEYYLRSRPSAEVKVFFDEAYTHGSAQFEDHGGVKYKLLHEGGEYQIIHL